MSRHSTATIARGLARLRGLAYLGFARHREQTLRCTGDGRQPITWKKLAENVIASMARSHFSFRRPKCNLSMMVSSEPVQSVSIVHHESEHDVNHDPGRE
jgi:hypothetical protein